jgi:hypothetical protein
LAYLTGVAPRIKERSSPFGTGALFIYLDLVEFKKPGL